MNNSFISLYSKYQPPSFICSPIMLALVISSLDKIYCIQFRFRKKTASWAKWARIPRNALMDEQLWSLTCFLVFACSVKKSKTGFFYWSSIGFNLRCTIWLLDLPQQVWIFSCAFSFAIFLPLTVAHSWLLFFILLHCSVFRTSISIWLHILIKKHISLAGYNREKMSNQNDYATSRHNNK